MKTALCIILLVIFMGLSLYIIFIVNKPDNEFQKIENEIEAQSDISTSSRNKKTLNEIRSLGAKRDSDNLPVLYMDLE